MATSRLNPLYPGLQTPAQHLDAALKEPLSDLQQAIGPLWSSGFQAAFWMYVEGCSEG